MRNVIAAVVASAAISCALVLPGSFVTSAQSQQPSAALPPPPLAEAFDPAVCGAQGWPYYDKDCRPGAEPVRIIRIGQSAKR